MSHHGPPRTARGGVAPFGPALVGSLASAAPLILCNVAAKPGIECVEFLLPSDGTGDPEKYVRALQLMTDPQRQPVLVHCGAGAQRTSTAVILYPR